MAAPQYVPGSPTDRPRAYSSPDYVPASWWPIRPAEVQARQPAGGSFGYQGPDQGYALALAERFRDRLHLSEGESVDDAIQGCLLIALRRASKFGRAPVVHDLTIGFTAWGFLDPSPPPDLVVERRRAFAGVGNPGHHYESWLAIAERVPESTLSMTPDQVANAYPSRWRELVG
jgi:hypothetical protein